MDRIHIPDHAQWVHNERIDVRWGDMDAYGHVNSIIYYQYFEQARAGWFREQNIKEDSHNRANQGGVVASSHCDYLLPIVYPADITIELYAGDRSKRSFQTWYRVRATEQPETLFALGRCAIVWLDHATGKAISIHANIAGMLPEAQK